MQASGQLVSARQSAALPHSIEGSGRDPAYSTQESPGTPFDAVFSSLLPRTAAPSANADMPGGSETAQAGDTDAGGRITADVQDIPATTAAAAADLAMLLGLPAALLREPAPAAATAASEGATEALLRPPGEHAPLQERSSAGVSVDAAAIGQEDGAPLRDSIVGAGTLARRPLSTAQPGAAPDSPGAGAAPAPPDSNSTAGSAEITAAPSIRSTDPASQIAAPVAIPVVAQANGPAGQSRDNPGVAAPAAPPSAAGGTQNRDRPEGPRPAVATANTPQERRIEPSAGNGEAPAERLIANPVIHRQEPATGNAPRAAGAEAAPAPTPQASLPASIQQLHPSAHDTAPAERVLQLNNAPATPAWRPEFVENMRMLVNERVQSAELRLNPADMGPVSIRITIADQVASIAFVATHDETRRSIEQALPQLRDMLAGSGIALGNAFVGSQSQHDARQAALINRQHADSPAQANPPARAQMASRAGRHLIDTYA